MPRHAQVDLEFKRHVCGRIDSYLTENGLTDVDAARDLGVSKAVIGDYRRAKSLPGTEVLAKACIHWNLSFDYKGFEISARMFPPQNGKLTAVPVQLELPFDEPIRFRGVSEVVENVELIINLKRVG